MKKKKRIIFIVVSVIILAVIFGPYVKDDILLNMFANQLYKIPLPHDTVQISRDKAVGNLSGTGNHLDFLATMVIKTSLSENELKQYYSERSIKAANKVSFMKLDTSYPDPIDANRPRIVHVEVIPKAQAQPAYSASKVFSKAEYINHNIDQNLYIIQIKDTNYARTLDMRCG